MKPSGHITSVLIFLTILLSPLYVIRFSILGIPTTVLEILILVTTIFWISYKIRYDEKLTAVPSSVGVSLLLISGGLFAGVIFSVDVVLAIGHARAYFIEPMIFGYIVLDALQNQYSVHVFKRTFSTIKLVLGSWFGASFGLSVLGLLQLYFSQLVITSHQFDRAHGVFNNANALALFIGPVLVYRISQYMTGKQKVSKMTIFDLVILLAFIATKSMGGILTLVVVTVCEYIFHKGFAHIWRVVLVGMSVAFMAFVIIISNFTPQVDNPWVRTGGTATIRMCVWEGTRNLLLDKPLIGAGLRSFQTVYSKDYTTCDAEPLAYPHNILLNFWVEIGIVGLAGVLLLLYKSINGTSSMVVSAILMYWVIQGMVDVPYFKNDLSLLFWITIALGMYLSKQKEKATK